MLVTISHCVQININQIKTERHAAPSTEVSRAAAAAAAASAAASSRSAIWGMGVTSRGAATSSGIRGGGNTTSAGHECQTAGVPEPRTRPWPSRGA